MDEINFTHEAEKLEKLDKHITAKRILKADNFDITLMVYDGKAEVDLHDCGNDELFHVLKGQVEIIVEEKVIPVDEDSGKIVLVKAGEKHKSRSSGRAWVLLISKHPHKHRVYK